MPPDCFPIERSVLAAEALRDRVLCEYDLSQPVTCRLYSRYANDIYTVNAGNSCFWLRVYHHDEFTRPEIEAEVAIMEQLASRDLPAVCLIPNRRGELIADLPAPEGMRYAVLTAHAPGIKPGKEITVSQAVQYGRAVAQIHLALDELPERYRRPQIDFAELLDEPLARLQPMLTDRSADWVFLCELAARLKQKLTHLSTAAPVYGLCHGDLHKSNVLMNEEGGLTIIDWDCLGYGWRAYELAVLRWSIGPAVGPEGIGTDETTVVWNGYLRGYQALRPLTAEEQAALPYFVAVRQIRVWGWDIQRALDGRIGTWFLTENYFDHWIGAMKSWVATECEPW